MKTELALSTLEGEDRKTVMLQARRQRECFNLILSFLEAVYRDVSFEAMLGKRFLLTTRGKR